MGQCLDHQTLQVKDDSVMPGPIRSGPILAEVIVFRVCSVGLLMYPGVERISRSVEIMHLGIEICGNLPSQQRE